MPNLPLPERLQAMIEQAMKDRAPKMHRELTQAGTLKDELRQRATEARQSFETAMDAALQHNSKASRNLGFQEGASELAQARDSAAEIAIAQATEFDEDPPSEEQVTLSEMRATLNELRKRPFEELSESERKEYGRLGKAIFEIQAQAIVDNLNRNVAADDQ